MVVRPQMKFSFNFLYNNYFPDAKANCINVLFYPLNKVITLSKAKVTWSSLSNQKKNNIIFTYLQNFLIAERIQTFFT